MKFTKYASVITVLIFLAIVFWYDISHFVMGLFSIK
jgi:hypothetical protein